MIPEPKRKGLAATLLLIVSMMLSACMLTPGKFASTLDIRRDGRFTFTYAGEMNFLALSDFAKNGGGSSKGAVFKPDRCTTGAGDERDCTTAEIDRQMRAWEEEQKSAGERKKRESEQMAAMFTGIDPSDPKAAQQLATSLKRQAGWRNVAYKGNGLFEVDYAISGVLGHDFVFPTIEGFPMNNPFVQLSLRSDGTVRIDAPGYSAGPSGGPFQGLAAMAMMDKSGGKKDDMPNLPKIDGTFTLTTDAEILANNTAEGPKASDRGNILSWDVNTRSQAAPTALVKLAR